MSSLKNGSDCHIEMNEPSEERNFSYRRVFENIPVGIAIVNCEGNCRYVNSRLCKILCHSKQELLGTGFRELISFKEIGIDFSSLCHNSQGTLKLPRKDIHCFKRGVDRIWISISSHIIVDPENKPNFVVLQINAITTKKIVDTSSKSSELSFESIYENVSDGIVINEQVGKFLEANPAICKKLGYRREELLQKTATEFIAIESSKIFAEQVRELYRNGNATVQVMAVCKEGVLLPVELNMWLIEYKGKSAIFSIITDVKE